MLVDDKQAREKMDTPRTDKRISNYGYVNSVWVDFARELEREVESLSAQVAGLTDQLAIEKRAVERWTNNAAGYAQKLDAAEAQVAKMKQEYIEDRSMIGLRELDVPYIKCVVSNGRRWFREDHPDIAQVAELKKDAERMEYLDKNMRVLRADADGVRHYIDVPLADSLRLAIDAAKESGVSP